MTQITITSDLPYFSSTADCQWETARRIAAELGDEHVAAVDRAERLAAAEAAEAADLVLCESPAGWSLHPPGSTDEAIASGDEDALYLVSGDHPVTPADYDAALRELIRRAGA
ncbi:MAG: hypothetical protein AB7E70_21685 [Hyphomicrobiaceae bacterium]